MTDVCMMHISRVQDTLTRILGFVTNHILRFRTCRYRALANLNFDIFTLEGCFYHHF